ncbi:mandelate racemase/muconate lactonizing enzyme family protein [Halocatena marina]|uniref:mandelate racemase/muconate lactonizing enzyme family protein n=1 Tax=Halocatena marina TaxID=2934937 RepID=UPI0020103FAA|nr:mandelate racemase/muconate lactonizing enzyme family protein [Halocatena marina]
MLIRNVEAIPVEMDVLPLESESEFGLAPYVSNHASVESITRMLIRVETDEKQVGWGEMLVAMKSAAVTRAVIEDVIAPKLIGRELDSIRGFIEEFYFPYVKVRPFLGAVETALWDALGNNLGVPVHQLLGGAVRERVPVAFCLGILPVEEAREHARRAMGSGFSTLKTKAGPDWRADTERLRAMHDAVNGEMEFRLDPNQGWTAEDTVRAAAQLEDKGVLLQYLEQPVRIDAYGTYAKLRERLRTPIAVNEDTYFPRNLRYLLQADAIDVAVVDLVPAGGIIAVQEQAALAAKAGVSVSHHCGFDLGIKTAAMLHVVGSTPGINLPPDSVYYAWADHIIKEPFEIDDGSYPVPDGPGLGITVDETKVEQYRID